MIIAAAISDEHTIVPIVEGKWIRIYDVDTDEASDFENPANTVTEGRRGLTLSFVKEKGAIAFLSPPETFCELSYSRAQVLGLRFIKLENNITFETVRAQLQQRTVLFSNDLPHEEILPSL